ncbi:MAG: hypothetical protein ACJ736_10160 [Streptomyces sp.]
MSLHILRNPRPPSGVLPTGTSPSPEDEGRAAFPRFPREGTAAELAGCERQPLAITALIVVLPFLALGLTVRLLRERLIRPVEVLLAAVLYTDTVLARHGRLPPARCRPSAPGTASTAAGSTRPPP